MYKLSSTFAVSKAVSAIVAPVICATGVSTSMSSLRLKPDAIWDFSRQASLPPGNLRQRPDRGANRANSGDLVYI